MAEYSVKYRIGVDTGDSSEKLDKVAKGAENVDNKMGKVTGTVSTGSGAASYALNNLNRVMQDAPYGMMGIANNIDPLVSSFQKLKQETGSNAGAFKALVGTLSGPMGVLFGVSAVIALIQIMPSLMDKFKKSVSETTLALDAGNKAYRDSYNTSMANIIVVKSLTTVLLDNTKTINQKKNALGKIQEIYPNYLKGVDLDKIKQVELNKVISEGNVLLQTRAQAMALQEQMVELYRQKMKIEIDTTSKVLRSGRADLVDPSIFESALFKQFGMGWRQSGTMTYNTGAGQKEIRKYEIWDGKEWRELSDVETGAVRLIASNESINIAVKKETAPIDQKLKLLGDDLAKIVSNAPKDAYNPSPPKSSTESKKNKDTAFELWLEKANLALKLADEKNTSLQETNLQLDLLVEWQAKIKPGTEEELKYLEHRNNLYQKYLNLSGGKPDELDILGGIREASQLRKYDLLPSLQETDKIIFDPLGYAKGDITGSWTKFQFFLERSIDLTASLKNGFRTAGDSLADALSKGLPLFGQTNNLLEIFIDGLVRATIQSMALAAINGLLGFLGGAVPFLSFLAPSVAGPALGGGNSPIIGNTAALLKAATSQRQTVIIGETRIKNGDIYVAYKAQENYRRAYR